MVPEWQESKISQTSAPLLRIASSALPTSSSVNALGTCEVCISQLVTSRGKNISSNPSVSVRKSSDGCWLPCPEKCKYTKSPAFTLPARDASACIILAFVGSPSDSIPSANSVMLFSLNCCPNNMCFATSMSLAGPRNESSGERLGYSETPTSKAYCCADSADLANSKVNSNTQIRFTMLAPRL